MNSCFRQKKQFPFHLTVIDNSYESLTLTLDYIYPSHQLSLSSVKLMHRIDFFLMRRFYLCEWSALKCRMFLTHRLVTSSLPLLPADAALRYRGYERENDKTQPFHLDLLRSI